MEQQVTQSLTSFSWIDYVIIAILAISVVISLIRGFVREIISLLTWIAAILMSLNFGGVVAQMFVGHISSNTVRFILAFAILFLGTLIVGAVVNYVISNFVKKTGLSGTDRVLGLVLGGARGILVIALLMLLASYTALPKDKAWQNSYLLPYFQTSAMGLGKFIPNAVDLFNG